MGVRVECSDSQIPRAVAAWSHSVACSGSQMDAIEYAAARSLAVEMLAVTSLPRWLALAAGSDSVEPHSEPRTVHVTVMTGAAAVGQPGCEGLPAKPTGLYAVLQDDAPITVTVNGVTGRGRATCLLVDLCDRGVSCPAGPAANKLGFLLALNSGSVMAGALPFVPGSAFSRRLTMRISRVGLGQTHDVFGAGSASVMFWTPTGDVSFDADPSKPLLHLGGSLDVTLDRSVESRRKEGNIFLLAHSTNLSWLILAAIHTFPPSHLRHVCMVLS